MTRRRRVLVAAGVVLLVAAAAGAMVVAGAAWRLDERRRGPGIEHRSEEGGFTVELPAGWTVAASPGADPDPLVWLVAERPQLLGPPDQWMWVHRSTAGESDGLEVAEQAARADIARSHGDVAVLAERTTWRGEPAVRLRHTRPAGGPLRVVPGNRIEEVRLITLRSGQAYEVGFGGWRSLAETAEEVMARVKFHSPSGTRTLAGPGFTVGLPSEFNARRPPYPDAPQARWVASSPRSWVMVWAFDDPIDRTLADSLAAASRLGQVTDQRVDRLAGRNATRIEFVQDVDRRRATFVTWHLTGDDGLAWQVLVGSWDDTGSAARSVERTFRFA